MKGKLSRDSSLALKFEPNLMVADSLQYPDLTAFPSRLEYLRQQSNIKLAAIQRDPFSSQYSLKHLRLVKMRKSAGDGVRCTAFSSPLTTIKIVGNLRYSHPFIL